MFRIARDAQQGDGAENPYWWCDPNQVARDCLQKMYFYEIFLCVLFWYLQKSRLIFSGGIWLLSCTSHQGLCKQRILNVTKNIIPINGQQQDRLGPECTK